MAITSVGLILVKCMHNRTMKSKTVNCIDFQVIIGLGCNKEVTFIWIISFLLLKALANEDTLLPTQMFPRLPARNICCGHKFCVRDTKMFLILFRNILCPQQMFPSLRSPRKIMGNNVSSFTRAFRVSARCPH